MTLGRTLAGHYGGSGPAAAGSLRSRAGRGGSALPAASQAFRRIICPRPVTVAALFTALSLSVATPGPGLPGGLRLPLSLATGVVPPGPRPGRQRAAVRYWPPTATSLRPSPSQAVGPQRPLTLTRGRGVRNRRN